MCGLGGLSAMQDWTIVMIECCVQGIGLVGGWLNAWTSTTELMAVTLCVTCGHAV